MHLDRLREAAGAATPGPWEAFDEYVVGFELLGARNA